MFCYIIELILIKLTIIKDKPRSTFGCVNQISNQQHRSLGLGWQLFVSEFLYEKRQFKKN